MIYGYIRVSTDKQTVENQRFEINEFCTKRNIIIEKWISETISGTKKLEDRKFGRLLKKLEKGDTVIISEISRIGRNLMQIMGILNECMERDVMVLTVREGYELGNNINSKVLAFAFGLSAEIERNLISQRTKEALARKRAEGVILGRPKGTSNLKSLKLYPKKDKILKLYRDGYSFSYIARKQRVNRITVAKFIRRVEREEVEKNLALD